MSPQRLVAHLGLGRRRCPWSQRWVHIGTLQDQSIATIILSDDKRDGIIKIKHVLGKCPLFLLNLELWEFAEDLGQFA